MATIKDIKISRNRGTRPTNDIVYMGYNWLVEKGEPYDLVQFGINEVAKPYFWHESLCVKCGTSEEEIKNLVRECTRKITDKDIAEYKDFLKQGERFGFD